MPLSSEEYNYFTQGINQICKKTTCKIHATNKLKKFDTAQNAIDGLSELFKISDFVAICSSLGIKAPQSIIRLSNSDIAQIQMAVGTVSADNPAQPSLMGNVDVITKYINNLCVTTTSSNCGNYDNAYRIEGEIIVLTKCIKIDKKYFILGDIITETDLSVLGILKTHSDCHDWANEKIDHYYTITGRVEDCSVLIPDPLVYSECVSAVGANIV